MVLSRGGIMKKTIYSICSFVFESTMILYMLIGLVIVFVQLAGILSHNPSLVFGVNKLLKMPGTWLSSISGLAGFAAYYCRDKKSSGK